MRPKKGQEHPNKTSKESGAQADGPEGFEPAEGEDATQTHPFLPGQGQRGSASAREKLGTREPPHFLGRVDENFKADKAAAEKSWLASKTVSPPGLEL
ncbi:hypothetical protein EI555_003923, partial [Monodon monoceros]